jgi:uncharacterized membrane protein YgcG
MGRVWRSFGFILAVGLLGLLVIGQRPAVATTERINNFQSRIVVHPDASLMVTETITVSAAGQEIKRGIIREFPTKYQDKHGQTVRVGFEIVEIRRDGRPEPYHTEKAANGVKIYIGQKDVLLQPGEHTYTITYQTTRQLGFFKEYDELYWNVTGDGWTFAIDAVQAVVELPPGTKIVQYDAYTGPFGAQGKDFRVSYDAAGNIVFTTTQGLAPREGLTIAVAWPKGIVLPPSAMERQVSFLKDNGPVLSGLVGLLALLGYYFSVWWRVGRDPAKGTIIPRFEPPKGFSPAAVRFLMRMGFDTKAFAAAVLDMAVKGYLTIKETDGAFVLAKKGAGALSAEEEDLGRSLFLGRSNLSISQTYQPTLANSRDALKDSLAKMIDKIYFRTNVGYFWPGLLITGLMLAGLFFTADDIGAAGGSILFYVVSCILLGVFYSLWQGSGWGVRLFFLAFCLAWAGPSVFLLPAVAFGSKWVTLALGGVMLLHFLFHYLLKAPTIQGRQIMDEIEGFKMYLSVAEKERLELLNPPEKTPALFEKYLPYALALNVENEWSNQFTEILAQAAAAGQAYAPSWYQGNSWSTQNFSNFADNLGSSLSSTISAAATPPSSSSGSGGGGSSGGGGGGGGGSGW